MALLPDPAKAGLPTLIGLLAGLALATFVAPATTEGFLLLVIVVVVLANVVARLARMMRRGGTGPTPEN